MDKIHRQIFVLLASVVVILFTIYQVNYKLILHKNTGELASIIFKIDLINQYFIKKFTVYDMTDIVTQTDKKLSEIKYCIIHHDTYPYDNNSWSSVNEYHDKEKGWGGIQYHYFISKSGCIYKNHSELNKTIHAGSSEYNSKSFAICIQGNFNNEYLAGEQKKSLILLMYDIRSRYKNIKFLTHKDVRETSCPGVNIDLNDLIELSYKPHKRLLK